MESYSSRILAGRSAALHYYHTFTALGTSGNYTNSSDPGNITSTSFNLLSLLEGRIELTRDPLGGWRLSDVSHEVYADTLGQACARLAKLRGHWGCDDSP